jgi:hypothetical protein
VALTHQFIVLSADRLLDRGSKDAASPPASVTSLSGSYTATALAGRLLAPGDRRTLTARVAILDGAAPLVAECSTEPTHETDRRCHLRGQQEPGEISR